MNDRIKLPAQEWLGYDPERGNLHGYTFDQMREFAELIIRECIDCVDDLIEPDPYTDLVAEDLYRAHNFALKQAMKHIRNRFGLEL